MAKIRPSILFIAGALLFSSAALADQTLRSRSGQFVVTGIPATPRFLSYMFTNSADWVRLDPSALAVTCDRIKEALLGEIDLADQWQSAVHIRLFPMRDDNEPVQFTSVCYRDGWGYELEMPDWIMRARLVTAVSQAVLTEIANRKAHGRGVELPRWLVEGTTACLMANNPDSLILEPTMRTVKRHAHQEAVAPIREALRTHSALTLDQLSWPHDESDPIFTHCAHLFVHELLHLRGGRRCMAELVTRLGENYNWQTTFLAAFSPHFQALIEVDKWWALMVAHVTGRDPMSLLPLEHALKHLEQTLLTPMQVRGTNTVLPGTAEAKLQNIITEWDDRRQAPLLTQKISQLQALRLRSPPEALALIDGYMLTLQNRVKKRMTRPDAVRRLNDLDIQRMRLNPSPAAQVDR
ncbi:MAG TPA: hypothetical protein VK850_19315 [Candidatus Binatia bacterium]|nr:hypothetical protein [Candidatus Binatia bacterium]